MYKSHKIGFYICSLVFALAILSIGNFTIRHQSFQLLLAFSGSFIAYIFLCREKNSLTFLLGLGIVVRLTLFFSMPSLSDDIYRFIWDGILLKNGIPPFENLPDYYLNQQVPGLSIELYNRLNSPQYFSIYPPVNQLIFWLSVYIGQGNWLVATNFIRLLLLLADVGSFVILKKLLLRYGTSNHLSLLFFLNPLVILEFTGNLHFEGFVIFFLLAGIYFYETSKKWLAGTALGLAIGSKLLPFIYLPYFLLKGIKDHKSSVAITAGFIAILTLLPLCNEAFLNGAQNSLDLYFRKFEFNASLYFLVREVGFWIAGYNLIEKIGPALLLISLISILTTSIIGLLKKWRIPKTMLFILSIYLLFATTIHPWYILPLTVLGILSGYYFPIVWSFMIFFTYLGYSENGFELSMNLVVIEYFAVILTWIIESKYNRLVINSI